MFLFTENQVNFCDSGATFTFHCVKNDISRSGFEGYLPRANCEKLESVSALWWYMERTKQQRTEAGDAVFLSLTRPYKAISASTVGKILEDAITKAGLAGQNYGPRSFWPTGATTAVKKHHNIDKVRKLGRWKTETVFLEHYVHVETDPQYTSDIPYW